MPSTRALVALATSTLMLAACDRAENAPGPGGVTVSEARALDEAAEMLEQRRVPTEAPPSGSPTPASAPSAVP